MMNEQLGLTGDDLVAISRARAERGALNDKVRQLEVDLTCAVNATALASKKWGETQRQLAALLCNPKAEDLQLVPGYVLLERRLAAQKAIADQRSIDLAEVIAFATKCDPEFMRKMRGLDIESTSALSPNDVALRDRRRGL